MPARPPMGTDPQITAISKADDHAETAEMLAENVRSQEDRAWFGALAQAHALLALRYERAGPRRRLTWGG